jgi:hypothetical protein
MKKEPWECGMLGFTVVRFISISRIALPIPPSIKLRGKFRLQTFDDVRERSRPPTFRRLPVLDHPRNKPQNSGTEDWRARCTDGRSGG